MCEQTTDRLKLELKHAFARWCALLTQQALKDNSNLQDVQEELDWLNARCRSLAECESPQRLRLVIRDFHNWADYVESNDSLMRHPTWHEQFRQHCLEPEQPSIPYESHELLHLKNAGFIVS